MVKNELAEIGAGEHDERGERRCRDLRADRDGKLVEAQRNRDHERQHELKSEERLHPKTTPSATAAPRRPGRTSETMSRCRPVRSLCHTDRFGTCAASSCIAAVPQARYTVPVSRSPSRRGERYCRHCHRASAELYERVAANWWLKFFGITGFIAVFFSAYFMLLRFPFFGVTLMPLTAVDRFISFQPWSLGLYYSLWFYVSLPPTLLRTRPELYAYGWIAAAMAVVALSIFFFWPTSIPATTGIDWASHPGFATLKRLDKSQNACPSLHVAFAVFSRRVARPMLRTIPAGAWMRPVSAVWCVGIVYSTIATRQHVAVDVAAGTALGLLFASIRPAALRASAGR